MDLVKCVNHLNAECLSKLFAQVERRELSLVMEFQGLYPDLENDLIGVVAAIKNNDVELEMVLELEAHHRFVQNSTFEFWNRGGRGYLVQLDPVVYK